MKQGRLSFSTKRKDREEGVEDVVVIQDSPEKPPPKKVRRASASGSEETLEEKDSPDRNEESPPKPEPATPPALPNDSDELEGGKKSDEGADEELDGPQEEPKNAEGSTEDADTGSKSGSDQERGSDADGEEVMEVSMAESSILDSTIDSTADESENNEKSDATTPTAPKRARLSKTESAYRSLIQKKDKELRQKEREGKLKQRQEEKERREQERKELRDRKEKERLEREKKKEEERLLREKERIEREKKKEEERLQKEKERIEKEKKKEEERQLKEKERLEKEKEKEEKEKLRKEKEDERRRREEEKKRELEEESAKKEKAKQAFMSFFLKRPSPACIETANDATSSGGDGANDDESHRAEISIKFRPFQLKKDMKLAAIVPEDAKNRFEKTVLESKLNEQNATSDDLYIKLLRRGYKPLKSNNQKTESQECEDQDVIVITRFNEGDDESTGGRMRAKFLHFCENYRPAYYGTWRKKCPQINGRKPFNKYNDFDYTVDSDDEWEEGEGESLAGTDDEKEEKDEAEEEYEEDDFLVPHGYLSESEEDEEDDQPMDPEALKARIAARQEEFKADRKAGLQKKKVVAVCALGPNGVALQEEIKVLSQFKAVLMVANGLQPSWERENELIINSKDAEPAVLTGKALELFCRTAHGFQGGTRALYDTFIQKWKAVSDVRVNTKSLKMTLTSYCKKSKSLNALVVDPQLVEKFGLETLETEASNEGTPHSSRFLPDDVIPELIKVTQGNVNASQVIEDFLALMTDRKFGKAQVKRTLANIGEFNQTQKCWLVKDECLKEHGLEDLKVEKIVRKDPKDDKIVKTKEPSKSRDEKKPKESGEDFKNSNKENDESSKESTKHSAAESPKVDTSSLGNSECSTPRRVSIKSFFTPKTKSSTKPISTKASASNSPKISASTVLKEAVATGSSPKVLDAIAAQVPTADTPKAKKRVQLTTLSRTPTLKEEKKSQAVLDKDELILIDESN